MCVTVDEVEDVVLRGRTELRVRETDGSFLRGDVGFGVVPAVEAALFCSSVECVCGSDVDDGDGEGEGEGGE